jgi:hypothetical protein
MLRVMLYALAKNLSQSPFFNDMLPQCNAFERVRCDFEQKAFNPAVTTGKAYRAWRSFKVCFASEATRGGS